MDENQRESCIMDLYDAVDKNMTDLLQNVMKRRGFDVNATFPAFRDQDHRGMSPVHLATYRGHIGMVNLLVLEKKCDLGLRTTVTKRIPLHFAVTGKHHLCVEFLLKQGSDVNSRDVVGNAPLHYAAYDEELDILETLKTHGAALDIRDNGFKTPLIKSVFKKNIKVIQKLTEYGCNVQSQDAVGDTALHVAVRLGSLQITRMLLEAKGDANIYNRKGLTPVLEAVTYGWISLVELFISLGFDFQDKVSHTRSSALHLAIQHNHQEIVKLLIERGCEQDVVNNGKESPIYPAIIQKNMAMLKFLAVNNYDLDFPAKFSNRFGCSNDYYALKPFHVAFELKVVALAKLLYEVNCEPLDLQSEALNSVLVDNYDMQEAIKYWEAVPSLKRHCRKCIRKAIGLSIQEKCTKLQLPPPLVKYILLEDIITS